MALLVLKEGLLKNSFFRSFFLSEIVSYFFPSFIFLSFCHLILFCVSELSSFIILHLRLFHIFFPSFIFLSFCHLILFVFQNCYHLLYYCYLKKILFLPQHVYELCVWSIHVNSHGHDGGGAAIPDHPHQSEPHLAGAAYGDGPWPRPLRLFRQGQPQQPGAGAELVGVPLPACAVRLLQDPIIVFGVVDVVGVVGVEGGRRKEWGVGMVGEGEGCVGARERGLCVCESDWGFCVIVHPGFCHCHNCCCCICRENQCMLCILQDSILTCFP